MDDREALIRAIRADPDDDTPRLVFADWLGEHGHDPDPAAHPGRMGGAGPESQAARAEFVRLQCWLSAHPETHPDWGGNCRREQELLSAHGRRWEAELAGYSRGTVEFHRGFVMSFYAHDVREFAEALPGLVRVTATDRLEICRTGDEDVGVFETCPAVADLRELETNADIRGLTEGGIGRLARSPHLQRLRRLDLSGAYPGPGNPDAVLLAREPVLPGLEHLHLGLSYPADVTRVTELLRAPHRGRLVGLTVSYLTGPDVEALCELPELARLTHLDIGFTAPTEAAARKLARCPYLDGVRLLACGGDGTEPLPVSARGLLRERFGDRVVLDPGVYSGGPVRSAYRRRVLTGRRS